MLKLRHSISTAVLAALAGIAATNAHGQDFRLIDPAGGVASKAPHEWAPFTHWDLREFPGCRVPWSTGSAPIPDLDGDGVANQPLDRAVFIAVCQAAFDRWDAVSPNELGFVLAGGAAPAGGFAQDNWNLMSWSAAALPIAVNAATLVWRSAASGIISEADIVFNSDTASIGGGLGPRTWVFKADGASCAGDFDFAPLGNWPTPADGDTDEDGDGNQELEIDVHTIATHEIGHLIGLDHIDPLGGRTNDPTNSVMEELWTLGFGPTGSGWANHTLKAQDEDGMNFLHSPDLGDAPDPWMGVFNQYPTLVHDVGNGRVLNGIQLDAPAKGAEHVLGIKPRQGGRNYTYEWLARHDGLGVTPECEANLVDRDPFDDGVTWYPNPPIWGRPLTVTAWLKHARDDDGNAHDYPARGLFANAWIDLNQNCIWEEWFLSAGFGPVPPPGPNAVATTTASATVLLPPAIDPAMPVWLRARVDYGENVGTSNNVDGTLAADKGAAQFGEVEDYPFLCKTKYEQQWPFHPLPYPVDGVAMVFVGAPEPGDLLWSPQVTDGDCIVGTDPTPIVTVVPTLDEMAVEYPVPVTIPPSTPKHTGICRPINPPARPVTLLRTFYTRFNPDGVPTRATTAREDVPPELRIPAVNCANGYPVKWEGPDFSVDIAVGAVDWGSGGWIELIDAENRIWSDEINVSVSYRLSPTLIPLESLSPCDPLYASLPLTLVGTGTVNPEDAFEFSLTSGEVPPGSYLILEVESSWNTNGTVNRQIVEFPEPFGEPTPVGDAPAPRSLALENYPNPFNPGTTIRYTLPEAAVTTLRVYDVAGRLVRTLFAGERVPAGTFEVEWDGRDGRGGEVASGIYFFRITTGGQTLVRKAVLLK
jgi:hypothetical protein